MPSSGHVLRRAPKAGLPHQTLVIVIVCAAVGGFVLVILLYRAIRSCRPRNAAPLPPIQPLAHQREHQLAQFEATLRAQNYDPTFLAAPPPPHSPLGSSSSRGSKASLLGSYSSPHTSYAQPGEGSEDLSNLSPLEPAIPLELSPSASTPGSSSINLNDSPTHGSPSAPTPAPRPRHSKSLTRSGRDDQGRPHHHRPSSLASSPSRSNSRRGTPHGPHSQMQIIMPAPLAPGIPPNLTRQSIYEHDSPSERPYIVDRWVPAGRDSIFDASTTHDSYASATNSNFGQARTPKPSGHVVTGSHINHRAYPSTSNVGVHPPPVPRVPSIYNRVGDPEGAEEDRGRKSRIA
ncbi:hypothetical protein P691DRAFT_2231 [Macrolepiota fuliginosa MF-IS2]|uniref:Uncharacterized protein n=1 Tax=Macrolepiota fuliginosa MF-IS2 TaxID=1400762 RepID=A0A9P5XSE3_9AGAR|nr:hypothetical protein P691DRAFT_2231 [Macrolepiota fuliginosa MF-IS2]